MGRAIALVACAFLCLMGCDSRSRSVFVAYGDAASTRLELNVASCDENPTADVEESETEVRVEVTSGRLLGRNADDCADGIVVILKEPLGTRSVIDQSTGKVVEVLPADEELPSQ